MASRLTIALSSALVGLAALATYLAVELKNARDFRSQAAAPLSQQVEAAPHPPLSENKSGSTPTSQAAQPKTPTTDEEFNALWKADMLKRTPEIREQLDNPDKRAELLRATKRQFRHNFPRLRERLALNAEMYSQLESLYADQIARDMEGQIQCAAAPACNSMAAARERKAQVDREIADLLGPEKFDEYSLYQDNIQERRAVDAFRGELPDALALSEAQAEKLIDALGETRRQSVRDIEQRGAQASSTWSSGGVVVVSSAATGAQQKYAEALAYAERQHDRVAQVLTGGQLQAYDDAQENLLENLRGSWEYSERGAAR